MVHLTKTEYVYILSFMENKTSSLAKPVLAEIAQECLCLQVRKTARKVTQWYDECLQPSGLRSTQFNLLVAIALAQMVPLTRLAEVLVLDRTTLARNLKPLESQELVEVAPGEDKRVRLIRITARGLQLLEQALPYWREAQDQVMARLGQAQWNALRADLSNLETQVP
jgi:DNA-binding MarR family transcriptional regulator